jgi:hypothetical protein
MGIRFCPFCAGTLWPVCDDAKVAHSMAAGGWSVPETSTFDAI